MKKIRIRPSSLERILSCPGSLTEEEGLPDTDNVYSTEGTKIHDCAAKWLQGEDSDYSEITPAGKQILEFYIMVANTYQLGSSAFFVEKKVKVDVNKTFDVNKTLKAPDIEGTADLIVFKGDTITILDLKCGHKKVHAKNNPQLLVYALGAYALEWRKLHPRKKGHSPITKLEMVIVQPALGCVDREVVTVDEAYSRMGAIDSELERALGEKAFLVAGEKQCRYCKARFSCPGLYAKMDSLYFLANKEVLTDEEKKELVFSFPFIKKHYNDIKEYVTEEVKKGNEFPGYVLGKALTRRQWNSKAKEVLVSRIGEEVVRKKLRPISEVKEVIKGFDFDKWTDTISRKESLKRVYYEN